MMTQRSLSAAALAQREHRRRVPSHSSVATPALPVRNDRTAAPSRCHPPLDAAFLIYGSAIKSRANLRCFNHMQFSNRRLKGGLRIILSAVSEIFGRASSLVASHSPLTGKFLIGTIDISENELSLCKRSAYRNPNGHKIGFSETPDCKCAAAESHPEKVISYRAGGRRMLLLRDMTERGLTSKEVSYINQRMTMNFSRRIFSFGFAVIAFAVIALAVATGTARAQ